MGFKTIDPATGEFTDGKIRDGYDRVNRLKTYDFARDLAEKCPGLRILLYDREYRINPLVFTFEKEGVTYGITLWDLLFSTSQAKCIIDQLLVMAEFAAGEVQMSWQEWQAWSGVNNNGTQKPGNADARALRRGEGISSRRKEIEGPDEKDREKTEGYLPRLQQF